MSLANVKPGHSAVVTKIDAVGALRPLTVSPATEIRIALAGNPICGKTSLFNALTGARQHVANYPGVTVERRTGRCDIEPFAVNVIDLPGSQEQIWR